MKGFKHRKDKGKIGCSVKLIIAESHVVFSWRRCFYIMRKEHRYYFSVLLQIVKYSPKGSINVHPKATGSKLKFINLLSFLSIGEPNVNSLWFIGKVSNCLSFGI